MKTHSKNRAFKALFSILVFLGGSCLVSAQIRKPPVAKKPVVTLVKAVEPVKPAERPVTVTLKEGEPVSGKFVNATSEGLQIVIAGNTLILKWNDIKNIVFTDVPQTDAVATGESSKVSKEKAAVEGAIKALRKLAAASGAGTSFKEFGITFQEYSRRFIDGKIEVEDFLNGISEGSTKNEIKLALQAYEDARAAWNWMETHRSGDMFPDYEPGKSLQIKYSLPTYTSSSLHLMEGDKALSIIWVNARNHIENAAKGESPK